MIPRHLTPRLLAALADTPVVFLTGARQVGKSTLARSVCEHDRPARYVTLDDATTLSAAAVDPEGFIAGLGGPVVLDEVQRVPELFLAIKAAVDRDRAPGRFLLTGSSHVLMLPSLAEALVGRMEVLTLWPLSQSEIETQAGDGAGRCLVDALFSSCPQKGQPPALPQCNGEGLGAIVPRVLAGGYPEAIAREIGPRRRAWFGSYMTTILQRCARPGADRGPQRAAAPAVDSGRPGRRDSELLRVVAQ